MKTQLLTRTLAAAVVILLSVTAQGQQFFHVDESATAQALWTSEYTTPQPGLQVATWNGIACDCQPHKTHCKKILNDRPCCDSSILYGQISAMGLRRQNKAFNRPLVQVQPGSQTALSTGDVDLSSNAGLHVMLGVELTSCTAVEFTYYGLHNWHTWDTVNGAANLELPGALGPATQDYFGADVMRTDYSARFHNFETNYTRCYGRVTLLGGFRYLALDEDFNINSTVLGLGTSDYHVATQNRLYGGQIGGRVDGWLLFLNWEMTGKLGVFGNAAGQSTLLRDVNNTAVLRNSTTTGNHGSLVGDFEFAASMPVWRGLALRGGLNLLWVEGLALAPDQLDFSNGAASGTQLRDGGGTFLYGGTFGVESRW